MLLQVRGALKMRSPKAKRIRSINKNKAVVETLNRYFPQDRASFGKSECGNEGLPVLNRPPPACAYKHSILQMCSRGCAASVGLKNEHHH